MKRYAATIQVLVTLKVRENPTTQSDNADWTAGDLDSADRHLRSRAAVAFVREAVASWGGQAPPDYVFFPSNLKVITRRFK